MCVRSYVRHLCPFYKHILFLFGSLKDLFTKFTCIPLYMIIPTNGSISLVVLHRRIKCEICRLMPSDGNSSNDSLVRRDTNHKNWLKKNHSTHKQEPMTGKHPLYIQFCAFLYSKFYHHSIPLLLVLLILNETEVDLDSRHL